MPDVDDMSSLVSSEVTPPSNVIKTEQPEIPEQLTTVRDDQHNGQAKMTLGQLALAGIVISSGPGGHFETYEGYKNGRSTFFPL
jgi:hypothetical protein